MHASRLSALSPPSLSGGTTTRATAGRDDTAQPPLTSGFGAVMEQEENIQSSIQSGLGADKGPNSAAIDDILRHQGVRLGANIALLEQRYESLPHPSRFQTLHTKHSRLSTAHRISVEEAGGVLRSLIAQHLDLLHRVEMLIRQRPDGQRGELILTEIARSHEEMASILVALIKDESAHDRVPDPVVASQSDTPALRASVTTWENEGGATAGPR